MQFKKQGFALLAALLVMNLGSSVWAEEKIVDVTGPKLAALLAVVSELKKEKVVVADHNYRIEENGTSWTVKVSDPEPFVKGGLSIYVVSKADNKVLHITRGK